MQNNQFSIDTPIWAQPFSFDKKYFYDPSENFMFVKIDGRSKLRFWHSDIPAEFFRGERIFSCVLRIVNPEVEPVKSLKNCHGARLIPAFGSNIRTEGVQRLDTARTLKSADGTLSLGILSLPEADGIRRYSLDTCVQRQ